MKILFLDIDGVLNSRAYFRHPDYVRRRKLGKELSVIWNSDSKDPRIDDLHFEMKSLGIGTEHVDCLNRIFDATGCLFVLSSSWRIDTKVPVMKRMLKARGFTGDLVDRTPFKSDLRSPCTSPSGKRLIRDGMDFWARGVEVWQWLRDNGGVRSYAILDDDSDFPELEDRLVQTTWESGLQDGHVECAIRILETPLQKSTQKALTIGY